MINLFTDALDFFGAGAWFGTFWFQLPWPQAVVQAQWSITAKELTLVVVVVALWGNLWRGKIVLVHCDNQAVVEVVNAGYSKDPLLMQLLQCLFFIMTYFEITVRANHIPGKSNGAADAISRNDLPHFFAGAGS